MITLSLMMLDLTVMDAELHKYCFENHGTQRDQTWDNHMEKMQGPKALRRSGP